MRSPLSDVMLSSTAPALILGATLPAAADTVAPAQTATGVVYEDINRNGKRDGNEKGIRGVSVSNGRQVVSTDKAGRYCLPADDQTIVSVTKPRGWMVPVDEANLPQFYYRHYPKGSPVALKYGGVKPTGPLPSSVDFALHRSKDPAAFEAVLFADPQTKSLSEIAQLEKDVVEELKGTSAAFGLTVGDVVNDPLDLFAPHNAVVAKVGIPWWNLPGNHDMDYDAPTDANATDSFKQVYGPTDYSFEYGRAHVVALDNVRHQGPGKGYVGHLTDEQIEWVRQDLAQVPADRLIIIAAHIPLKNVADTSPGNNTANLDKLLGVLAGREHVYTIAGHDTSNGNHTYLGAADGWKGTKPIHHHVLAEVRGGGWITGPLDGRGVRQADMADGNPNGFYRLAVQGTTYRPHFKPASLPADFLMRIGYRDAEGTHHVPAGPSGSGDFTTPVAVSTKDLRSGSGVHVETNVFDGGARHKVEMSVDGRAFRRMTHSVPVNDPYITDLSERLAGTKDAPAKPEASTHIWTAPLPGNLRPGAHRVVVRSTDAFGKVAQRQSTFTVER